jgi:hypothetical protein
MPMANCFRDHRAAERNKKIGIDHGYGEVEAPPFFHIEGTSHYNRDHFMFSLKSKKAA